MIETRTLEVTEEDIRLGRRRSAFFCPFALAGKRLFGITGTDLSVVTGRHDISTLDLVPKPLGPDLLFWGPGRAQHWTLPLEAEAVIVGFDVTGHMEPGTYTITQGQTESY